MGLTVCSNPVLIKGSNAAVVKEVIKDRELRKSAAEAVTNNDQILHLKAETQVLIFTRNTFFPGKSQLTRKMDSRIA